MAKDKPPSRGPKIPDDVNAPSSGGKRKPSAKGRKTKTKSQQKRGGLDPIVCIGIGAALVPLVQRVIRMIKNKRGGGDDGDGGKRSAFSFGGNKGKKGKAKGGGKGAAGCGEGGIRKPPGAASPSGGPRTGKMANNKKAKAKSKERKERQRTEAEAEKHRPGQLPKVGDVLPNGKVVVKEGNNIPKDEDIVGGEAGKTFTTTSHVKVPTWYAKVREERGND